MAEETTETSTETKPKETPSAEKPPETAAASNVPPDKRKQPRGQEVRIPQSAFKARIQREAAAIIRARLGVSLEDAEKIVKAGGKTPEQPANGAAPTTAQANQVADEALKALQKENERLRKEAEKHKKLAEDEATKRRREVQRLKDKQLEAELDAIAKAAGIRDTAYFRFAFRNAVIADAALTPQKYIEGLKTTHKHLFVAPEPPTVSASTAPPESKAPGETKPNPAPAGNAAQPKVVDVDKMSPQEFARHTRGYGYTPGMS